MVLLQDVDKQEEKHPNHVHKVPIPARSLESKVVRSRKVMTSYGTEQLNQQHCHAHENVETVEARQHKEG